MMASLAIIFISLVVSGTLHAATLHYAPVVISTGDRIAYFKREYRYSVSGGGIIPFMGGKPTRVKVKSDRIQLCVKDLKTGCITVVKQWKPKLVKREGRLYIKPLLNWELDRLRYITSMRSEQDPGIGIYRRPYVYLANIDHWSKLEQGRTKAGSVCVGLNEDVSKIRFPKSNKVIVEKTWEADKALPGIRQRLEELSARRFVEARSETERSRAEKLSDVAAGKWLSRLPEKLVDLFLAESKNSCGSCTDLAAAVILLGEGAVEPLVQRYDEFPSTTKLAVYLFFVDGAVRQENTHSAGIDPLWWRV